MKQLIELNNVSKIYGKNKVLHELSFSMTNGIYGLIGPNGAGKSTLIKIISTLIKMDEGTILYNGNSIHSMKAEFYTKIGLMPQNHTGYDNFVALQFLYYMATLKGMKKEQADYQINVLIKQVGLEKDIKKKIKEYSGGMRQRLMFAQAMLNDPSILILDEPTAGLDPLERIKLRNFISQSAQEKIVIIATHVMQDIESIANELIFLKEGNLLFKGSSSELLKSLEGKVHEKIIDDKELIAYQMKYKVSRMIRLKEQLLIRYIGEDSESGILANLEDAYLYHLG